MSTNRTPTNDLERAHESAEALAALERRAAEQGIRPFSADDWLSSGEEGSDPEEIKREVDDFLGMLREWRDTPSSRSLG